MHLLLVLNSPKTHPLLHRAPLGASHHCILPCFELWLLQGLLSSANIQLFVVILCFFSNTDQGGDERATDGKICSAMCLGLCLLAALSIALQEHEQIHAGSLQDAQCLVSLWALHHGGSNSPFAEAAGRLVAVRQVALEGLFRLQGLQTSLGKGKSQAGAARRWCPPLLQLPPQWPFALHQPSGCQGNMAAGQGQQCG